MSTLALAAGLWLNGSYGADAAGASLLMLLPALLGMGLGQWLRGRLSPRVFKLCFMASLALLGIYQVFRAWLARAIPRASKAACQAVGVLAS